jgi:hypothetical protein
MHTQEKVKPGFENVVKVGFKTYTNLPEQGLLGTPVRMVCYFLFFIFLFSVTLFSFL